MDFMAADANRRGWSARRYSQARAEVFWRDFDAAANTFTIGEVFSGDPVYVADYSNYLDATLDFPLYYTINNVFAKNFLQST